MAAYLKFNDTIEQIYRAKHDFGSHTFKIALTDTAPVASNTVFADITEIAAGSGYTAGGNTLSLAVSETTGTVKITATDTTFTASGGDIGPFRYLVIYNDTQTSPADALVAYYDYGSEVTITNGNAFLVDFDDAGGLFTAS